MSNEGWSAYLAKVMRARKIASASELARLTGVSQGVISRWQHESTAPSVENLRRLARGLDIPLLDLMVAAGVVEPKEAKMTSRPAPPEPPVGAGVDAELLADAERLSPAEVQRVRDFIRGIKAGG